jgi:hypothetical protein
MSRPLTELEHWILEVVAKASEEGKKGEHLGMKLSPGLVHRTTLVAVLKPANTSDREGLSWGPEQERELDLALTHLFTERLVANLDLVGQQEGDRGAEARMRQEIEKLSHRVGVLERSFDAKNLHSFDIAAPFGIAGLGWVKLREAAAAKQEGLAGA